jgi:hypothetical protein
MENEISRNMREREIPKSDGVGVKAPKVNPSLKEKDKDCTCTICKKRRRPGHTTPADS